MFNHDQRGHDVGGLRMPELPWGGALHRIKMAMFFYAGLPRDSTEDRDPPMFNQNQIMIEHGG